MSLMFVTVTSGFERKACASNGVLFAQVLTSALSYISLSSAAFWMQTIWWRTFGVPMAALRPSGVANCMLSHASNCVQKRDTYERSRRMRTVVPR